MPARRARDKNRTSVERTPILIVQTIARSWTKAERGEPFAAARNAVPRALPLPEALSTGELGGALITHYVAYDGEAGFAAPARDGVRASPLTANTAIGNVAIRSRSGLVSVDLLWSHGLPRRIARFGIATLHPGEWVQVEYNYRTGGGRAWGYGQDILNIALVADAPTPRLFLDTPPTRCFRDLAHLW